MADSTMIKEYFEPILGSHFDLYLVIFSPLTYLFGTYTLLIVQIIAIAIGGFGVYSYFKLFEQKNIPIYAAIYFFLFYGIYGALSFDYHSVVVASSLVPWFFITIQKNKKILSLLLLFGIIISQENISLWMAFICLGLAIKYRNKAETAAFLGLLTGISITYFITITNYIIPYFSTQNSYSGFHYSCLGYDIKSALMTLLTQPLECIKILFLNHNNSFDGDYVKIETHILILTSGLFLLIRKPYYILMLIPIYFQKFFHDDISMWSIGGQYNIEFAPVLAIGIFSVISEFKNKKTRTYMSYIVLTLALCSTFKTMDNTVFYTNKTQIRFYKKAHYERELDIKNLNYYLSKIPEDAKVSAQVFLVPHLALRDNIYQFPIIMDADYIIYCRKEGAYPLTKPEFDKKADELESSKEWVVCYKNEVTILKRNKL
jgi:uncharacterized membrane protein